MITQPSFLPKVVSDFQSIPLLKKFRNPSSQVEWLHHTLGVRRVSVTTDLLRNVPIAGICKTATWGSVGTFTRQYYLEESTEVFYASERDLLRCAWCSLFFSPLFQGMGLLLLIECLQLSMKVTWKRKLSHLHVILVHPQVNLHKSDKQSALLTLGKNRKVISHVSNLKTQSTWTGFCNRVYQHSQKNHQKQGSKLFTMKSKTRANV